jgi:Ser/Thr protein kinase RdoA (MazF antagonist)
VEPAEVRRAVAAAGASASMLGLAVHEAVVLSDSNRLVVRLAPCDVVARVAPANHFASASLELAVVAALAATGSPVAPLDPRVDARVHTHDGFEITFWSHLAPAPPRPLPPAEYADTLARLHAGLRGVDVAVPHVMQRIAAIEGDVADHDVTPDLTPADRALLAGRLRDLEHEIVARGAPEQLLHGEPHPGNVHDTSGGLVLLDFENAARGPVEYDLGWVPAAVAERVPGVDADLVDSCRGVVLAIVAAHRWRADDQHPSGRRSGVAFLDALRAGPPWPALDAVTW